MGMGIAFRPLMERTERKSVKELVEAEGYKFVWDDEHEFVVDILGGPYEED